jgi:hypothetical protein
MRITANQVTIARLIGLPFVGAPATGDEQCRIIAVILGTLIGLTDTIDWLPGAQTRVTVLGSLLRSRRRQGVHRRLLRHLRRHGHHPVVDPA